jgi:hypothetical protein
MIWRIFSRNPYDPRVSQGYLAHKKLPPPLGPPYDPRYSRTVGSLEGGVSHERGTPVLTITVRRAAHMEDQNPSLIKKSNQTLSGDEVYYAAYSLPLILKHLSNELHCQKGSNLILFSYKIRTPQAPLTPTMKETPPTPTPFVILRKYWAAGRLPCMLLQRHRASVSEVPPVPGYLVSKSAPLGPYSRTVPWALWWS